MLQAVQRCRWWASAPGAARLVFTDLNWDFFKPLPPYWEFSPNFLQIYFDGSPYQLFDHYISTVSLKIIHSFQQCNAVEWVSFGPFEISHKMLGWFGGSTHCVLIQSWQNECPLAVLKKRFFILNLICILRKIVLLGRVFIKMRQDYFMVLSQPVLLHWRYYNIQDNIFQCWHFTVNWMVSQLYF